MSFYLANMDAVELLQELGNHTIDLVVTDPAYESLERHRKKGSTTRLKKSKSSSNEWFEVFPNSRAQEFFDELYRVMKPMTHAYIMCDDPTDEVYRVFARNSGFWVWKSLIWEKTKANGEPKAGMGYHWRNCTERILFLEKRTRRQFHHSAWTVRIDPTGKGLQLNNKGWVDCLRCPPVHDGYPTEKPVSLLKKLILNSSQVGDIVLDPFMGSGSTGEAALSCNREFLGGDISSDLSVVEERLLHALE